MNTEDAKHKALLAQEERIVALENTIRKLRRDLNERRAAEQIAWMDTLDLLAGTPYYEEADAILSMAFAVASE